MYYANKYQVNDQEITLIEVFQKNIKVTFMDYGASIISIVVPDKDGSNESVLMAYDSLDSYLNNAMYLNATIGPTSGRIKDGLFSLNDQTIQLDKNENNVNLHGGKETFAFQFFTYEVDDSKDFTKVTFCYQKKQEQSSFPGNQEIKVIYTAKEGELLIEFQGTTDQDTLLNMTNHSYFNLSGNMKRNILDHHLYLNASYYAELDEEFVPSKLKSCKGTHLEFNGSPIKNHFYDGIYQTKQKGIDDPLLLDDVGLDIKQVELFDPVSKRVMEVYTTYPCIVCYTHNYPDFKPLLYGRKHEKHLGICFETQFVPNGINMEKVHKAILKASDIYSHKTLLKFYVKE